MRGVIIFLTALFMLAPYFLVMTNVIEPLMEVVLTFDLSPVGGAAKVETLKDIMFLWAPFVYVAGWFVWALRYYMSSNLFTGAVGGGGPRR